MEVRIGGYKGTHNDSHKENYLNVHLYVHINSSKVFAREYLMTTKCVLGRNYFQHRTVIRYLLQPK